MKDIIEFTASIATLILFLFYFIGRIAMVLAVRKYWRDKVIFDEDCEQKYDVVDEVQIPDSALSDSTSKAVLLSCEGIRHLKIYRAACKKDKDGGEVVVRGEILYEREFLNVNQAILIEGETGDLFPTLFIEYESHDFMKVNIEWRDNLKNGVFSEIVIPRHTIKSVLYYVLR